MSVQTHTVTATGGSESFAALFEESLKSNDMRVGEVISAEVVRIEYNHVVVNAGLKSEAYVPIEEFKNDQGELEVQVGDFVSVAIDAVENGYGDTILSRDKAKRLASWMSLENSLESGEFVTGTVNGKVKGGLTVLVNGIRAFLPGSLLDTRPVKDMSPFEGKTMEFKVIKLDRKRNNVVLSRRAVVEASMGEERAKLLETLHRRRHRQRRGQEHHRIRRVRRPRRHRRPAAHHRHGLAPRAPPERGGARSARNCTAKVLKFDAEKNRVSLGIKQLGDDPWHGVSRRYPNGTRLFGKITNIADYGAFVEIEPGIEGLVHVSEMDWTNKNVAPSQDRHAGRRGRGHGARDRRGQAPHQPGHEAVQGQPLGRVRRHRQARRQGQGPRQVDHRLRRLRRPGGRHRRPGAPVRPVLARAGRERPCATTRRARKSKPWCWPSTSSASASAWASSSSTATRSPASPRSTTAARWSPARSRRSTRAAPRSSSTTTSPATCAPPKSAATASKTRATC